MRDDNAEILPDRLIRLLADSLAISRSRACAPIDQQVLLQIHLQRQLPVPSWSNRHSSDRYGRCRKRPRGHGRFRALYSTPSAVLFLLRMPDNKFFEKPIHARTACKPETFSHHHLRCAIRRRQAYSRKAGRSMEFHPQSRFRGDPQDIQHTAAERSTGAADRENSHYANRRPWLAQCCRRQRPVQDLCTRSLQSPAAIPLHLSPPSHHLPSTVPLPPS